MCCTERLHFWIEFESVLVLRSQWKRCDHKYMRCYGIRNGFRKGGRERRRENVVGWSAQGKRVSRRTLLTGENLAVSCR